MRERFDLAAWVRCSRVAALIAGALLLAGCATGYRVVQPDAPGSGSYYTSSGPYPGSGYYDYYGTGPYYAGTSGWGYYNGSWPYQPWFGYAGWGDWPWFTFGAGYSNVWNFPGYWGPWYTGQAWLWRGCRHRHCDRHHHRGTHGADNAQYLGVMSVRPTVPSSQPTPQTARAVVLPRDFGPRGAEGWQGGPEPFGHGRFVHAPVNRPLEPRPAVNRTLLDRAPVTGPQQAVVPSPSPSPQARNRGFQPPPRLEPQPLFQPRSAEPRMTAPPRPHASRGPDPRHH